VETRRSDVQAWLWGEVVLSGLLAASLALFLAYPALRTQYDRPQLLLVIETTMALAGLLVALLAWSAFDAHGGTPEPTAGEHLSHGAVVLDSALLVFREGLETILVLAAFVGFEVISKVPTTLHTPLMSQTNAIHGIVMLGGLIVLGYANDPLEYVIGTIAVAFGTINIVGGFMVTDRMLGMFSKKPKPKADAEKKAGS